MTSGKKISGRTVRADFNATPSVLLYTRAAHPEFEPLPLGPEAGPAALTLWPHELHGNGMFIAAWRRR